MRFATITAAAVAALIVAGGAALADPAPFGIGPIRVGMTLDELRGKDIAAEGRRILCDSDKTDELSAGDREILRVTDSQAAAGLSRCGLYAKEENGSWTNRRVGVGGQPAEFLLLMLNDDGTSKVMQIQLYQEKSFTSSTSKALTEEFGNPVESSSVKVRWSNPVSEATLAQVQNGFYVYISDVRLQRIMRDRLGIASSAK